MTVSLSAAEKERQDSIVTARRKVKRGSALFRSGQRFESLYAIRT